MPKKLWVSEIRHAVRTGEIIETDIYESKFDNVEDLYALCLKEHGQFKSFVYVDQEEQKSVVGWLFEKTTPGYDSYVTETAVTVHTGPPTVKTTYHYVSINERTAFNGENTASAETPGN